MDRELIRKSSLMRNRFLESFDRIKESKALKSELEGCLKRIEIHYLNGETCIEIYSRKIKYTKSHLEYANHIVGKFIELLDEQYKDMTISKKISYVSETICIYFELIDKRR